MTERKRVLMSAFACSPLQSSEAGVGWHWAVEAARLGHEVTVLTRTCYRKEIEAGNNVPLRGGTMRFVYLDLAPWINWSGFRKILGYLYIYIWQVHAFVVAARLHKSERFELVHHITFGGIRFPTFLGLLGVPLVFGPVGGGERAPTLLRKGYPLRGKIVDGLRDLSNWMVRIDPLMHLTFATARHIVLRTPETVTVVPRRYQSKVMLERDVGVDCTDELPRRTLAEPNAPRVLYVGRNIYWKGMHLGLPAFAVLKERFPKAALTIVGRGPERAHWQGLARTLDIEESINWVDWVDNRKIGEIYRHHDIFLFPSLHDSGGTVIYEAAANGLPIVCLALGGPGVLVDQSFGVAVPALDRSEVAVVADLAEGLTDLTATASVRIAMGEAARRWALEQTWSARVGRVYSIACSGSPSPSNTRPAAPTQTSA